jgi:hypothetical protein
MPMYVQCESLMLICLAGLFFRLLLTLHSINFPHPSRPLRLHAHPNLLPPPPHDPFPQYALRIEPGPPSNPFVNHAFEITVHLVDRQNHPKIGHQVPLIVDLVYDNGEPVPRSAEVMHITPAAPVISGTGQLKLKLCFLQMSLQHGGRSFAVRVMARSGSVSPPLGAIDARVTAPMRVIKHQVRTPPHCWSHREYQSKNHVVFTTHTPQLLVRTHVHARVLLTANSFCRLVVCLHL